MHSNLLTLATVVLLGYRITLLAVAVWLARPESRVDLERLERVCRALRPSFSLRDKSTTHRSSHQNDAGSSGRPAR